MLKSDYYLKFHQKRTCKRQLEREEKRREAREKNKHKRRKVGESRANPGKNAVYKCKNCGEVLMGTKAYKDHVAFCQGETRAEAESALQVLNIQMVQE